MSENCCSPCPEIQTVSVPGVEGADGAAGADGTDGVNAFTQSTADFEIPIVGANVTVSVLDSTWMAEGQKLVADGPATFEVVSKPTSTAVILEFLGYVGDIAPGQTIATGANISPAGTQGEGSLLPEIGDYNSGGSDALTTTPAQALLVEVTLTESRKYLLQATVRFDFDTATFPASENITASLRRTNNTPANITNAEAVSATGVTSAQSGTVPFPGIPPVVYNATAGDVIALYVSLSDTPYSGAVNVVETAILAIPLF